MSEFYIQASAVFLGCIILIGEAWREYGISDAVDRLKSSNQPTRKELENVRISALTTKAEYRRGRRIYIIVFVALYFLLISTPEIAGAIFSGGNGEGIADGGVNAVFKSWVSSSEVGSPQDALSRNPTLPISLAITMVIGVTSPTFAFVERTIRSLAYAIAGVPRNVYSVLDNLEGLDYCDYASGEDLPLYDAFEQKAERYKLSDGGSSGLTRSISEALRIIDLLQSPVIGPQRNIFRSVFLGESPMERIDDLRTRYTQIRGKIADLDSTEGREQTLDELQQSSIDLTGSMQCLFALYAIRSKGIPEILRDTPQARIIKDTTGNPANQSLDNIAIAGVIGAVVGVFLVSLYASHVINNANIPVNGDAANSVHNFTRSVLIPLLPSLLIVSLMTVLRRHAKLTQGSYPKMEDNQVPFWTYSKLAVLPTLLGTLLFGTVMVANTDASRLLMAGFFSEARNSAFGFMAAEFYQLPRIIALFFFYSCGLLFITDQHENLPSYVTIGIVATLQVVLLYMATSVFPVLLQFKVKASHLTNNDVTLIHLFPVAAMLYIYATAAEFAEKDKMKKIIRAAKVLLKSSRAKL